MSDADRAKAAEVINAWSCSSDGRWSDLGKHIAAALAAERAAAVADLRARVEAVAEKLGRMARRTGNEMLAYGVELLRAAVTDTTGGTQ